MNSSPGKKKWFFGVGKCWSMEFYKKDYTDTLKSNENNKKLKLKEFIVDFHKEYKIKYSKKIEQLINKIENK